MDNKTFNAFFTELKEFCEKNGHMPRPQVKKDKEEQLLGLQTFRVLQSCTVQQENKVRNFAAKYPGPCPKKRTDRLQDLIQFCEKNNRLPKGGEEEKSLYAFYKKNRDRAEFKEIAAKYEKKGV